MKFENLDDLRVLIATADAGSLTAAGRQCGLSTAAVSSAIKRLERSLGVRLFERTTRAVRPTDEGLTMIDHARRALDLLMEGQSLVRADSAGLSGTIRLTVAPVLARDVLAQWLAEFSDMHPELSIDLQVSDALVDLVRENIDLALRYGPLSDSSHCARLLTPARRVACASPAYIARYGEPRTPDELAAHACLVYHMRGRPLDSWAFGPALGSRGTQGEVLQHYRVRVGSRLVCNDASIAKQWAVNGRGVVYLSELALSRSLACGDLVRLFPDLEGEEAPLYAVLPSQRYVPKRVRVLVDQMGALFDRELQIVRGHITSPPMPRVAAA